MREEERIRLFEDLVRDDGVDWVLDSLAVAVFREAEGYTKTSFDYAERGDDYNEEKYEAIAYGWAELGLQLYELRRESSSLEGRPHQQGIKLAQHVDEWRSIRRKRKGRRRR